MQKNKPDKAFGDFGCQTSDNFGKPVEVAGNMVNPIGYQTVLYVTLALYVVALVLSLVFVKPVKTE